MPSTRAERGPLNALPALTVGVPSVHHEWSKPPRTRDLRWREFPGWRSSSIDEARF